MPVDTTVFGELTKPFRFADISDNAILTAFPLARAVEAPSFFSVVADVEAIANERFSLLSVPRRRFLVTVEGTDFIVPDDFAGQCPCAMLRCSRWGLSAGRRVAIVKFTIDYANDRTQLLVWG